MSVLTIANVGSKVRGYVYADIVAADILYLCSNFRALKPQHQTLFVFPNGSSENCVSVKGTIPVMIRGQVYNIPIAIWIRREHPLLSPWVYVTPTQTMRISHSQYVDSSGRVYLPFLSEWKPDSSDLTMLVQVMCATFVEHCPVYSVNVAPPPHPSRLPRPRFLPPHQLLSQSSSNRQLANVCGARMPHGQQQPQSYGDCNSLGQISLTNEDPTNLSQTGPRETIKPSEASIAVTNEQLEDLAKNVKFDLESLQCKFVDPFPKEVQTDCPICLQILKEPHSVGCCGYRFCKSCLLPRIQHCPMCKTQNFDKLPDKQLERLLNQRAVYCLLHESGCKWTGELCKLSSHLNLDDPTSKTACDYMPFPCEFCGKYFKRMDMSSHKAMCMTNRFGTCMRNYLQTSKAASI